MTTLLEKAKELASTVMEKRKYTEEDVDLVLAYLNEEITAKQVKKVKDFSLKDTYSFYSYITVALQYGVKKELIFIKRKEEKSDKNKDKNNKKSRGEK